VASARINSLLVGRHARQQN